MAVSHPLAIDQGETFRCSVTYALPPADWTDTQGVPPADSVVPIDLTGCAARMQIRDRYGAPVLAEATTDNGGITLGGTSGVIDVLLTDVQTDALGVKDGSTRPRTTAVYDLEVRFPSGDVARVLQGEISIEPNITRVGP